MMAHTFNPNTREADLCEFKASLVYKVSSRTARATQRSWKEDSLVKGTG